MSKKLYVGNLSYDTGEETLKRLFDEGGWPAEEVAIITDRDTGRPRGFGFVTLTNDDDADAAIAGLNGREVDGREIVVNEARERRDRGGDRRGGRGGGGGGRGRW